MRALAAAAILLCLSVPCAGQPTGHEWFQVGPNPKPKVAEPATGMAGLFGHQSRVFSMRPNIYFSASQKQTIELLELFSTSRLRDSVVRLKSGRPTVATSATTKLSYNVNLTWRDGIAALRVRPVTNERSIVEPILEIYVADATEQAFLERWTWPEHVVVCNEVDGWLLTSKRRVPVRHTYHSYSTVSGKLPANSLMAGIRTSITLWETDRPGGFYLGAVDRHGWFATPLSDEETEKLSDGRMFMTATIGDSSVKALRSHQKIRWTDFARDPMDAGTMKIKWPPVSSVDE